MAIHISIQDELKKIRKEKRALVKREKDLKTETSIEKDTDRWQRIMDAKVACYKIIKSANLGKSMNLTKLEKFPDFYIYQHPTQRDRRTNNRNELWVQQYIGEKPMDLTGGVSGVEADLLDTAQKTRFAAWKRVNKKKKRVAKVLSQSATKKGGSGKAKAVGSVGVG